MGELDGKIALISGGSSGIGPATAKRFFEEGAYTFITGRREAELSNIRALQGDVSKHVSDDAGYITGIELFVHGGFAQV